MKNKIKQIEQENFFFFTFIDKWKVCRHCLLVKAKTDFNKDDSKKDKLESWCSQCKGIYNNAPKVKQRKKKYNKKYYKNILKKSDNLIKKTLKYNYNLCYNISKDKLCTS